MVENAGKIWYTVVIKLNWGSKMAKNSDLNKANKAKKDEFYTQLADIEVELKHYRKHFKDKVVFCNCDDPYESNFFKYFAMNFNFLGLKKLIATCYMGSPVVGEQFEQLSIFDILPEDNDTPKRYPYKIEITEVTDTDGDGAVTLTDVEYLLRNKNNVLTLLDGDGDFRSPECVEILKQADIVVTNPPFSLFRDFVAQLVEYGKQFLIIGNVNAVTYKEVFPLIKDNKMWMGYSIHSGDREFRVPDDYPLEAAGYRIDEQGRKYIRVKGVRWFTNMDYVERHTDLDLWKTYNPDEYPKYDNYDAINVDATADIPEDYYGIMGVPITFLDKYNPDQFEILGISKTWYGMANKTYPNQLQIDKKGKQSIVSKLNDGPVLNLPAPPVNQTYYVVDDKYYIQLYARILIRRRQNGN